MPPAQFDLIAIGHIVCETIFFPDKTIGPVLGSPPAYSLVAAARQGMHTGVVTKVGEDFPRELLDVFKDAGVDTTGIGLCKKSTLSNLIYDERGNKEIRFPSRADYIKASDIPDVYKNCRMMYVCTMEDDIPLEELAEVAITGRTSAIDLGGYGGVHMSKTRSRQIADISAFALQAACHFDFVKASDEDCRTIFGEGNPDEFAKKLLSTKTKASLVTCGDRGVMLGTKDGVYHIEPLAGNPIDATGGGDAFMGGFLSEYLRCGDVMKSAVFGSATALCVIEKTGGVLPERMPTEDEVRARIPDNALNTIVRRIY